MESHFRTVLKSLTWRAGGLLMTTGVALWLTGEVRLATQIGIADTVIKLFAYYGHERVWLKIKLGRQRPPDYQI